MTDADHDLRGSRTRGHDRPQDAGAAAAELAAYIERKGLKHSRQRERIAQAFFAVRGHVTVEELVAHARRDDPRVSVATVYRTMKLLVDCGLASARQFGEGQTRYEPSAGRAHHDHLICTGCGDIVEFANEKIESLQETVARRHGFEVESHKLELYGRCARCRKATPVREERA
ncbi:Fur family transcriptional regulator [Anaeromyxobacter sp. SG66]|uniref:Fur family transcriptional regulator n=1 Tax=Anaeromyxobacter sp. SG66 TaxID=2925410 RepID=UPI001F5ABC19|nr:transcriptional repressor [Anaeromyxobacter sp. SG66]